MVEIAEATKYMAGGGGGDEEKDNDIPVVELNEEEVEQSTQAKPAASLQKQVSKGGTKSYDEGIHDSIMQRMDKYKEACSYCSKVLGDKKRALKMLDEAEKLKQVATDYKCTNKFDKSLLAPQLTSEILFGISKEDKAEKFQLVIDDLDKKMKEESTKAKKCLEGSKAVKKPAE